MAVPSTEELYESVIAAHYESSRYRGRIDGAKLSHSERNPICGDSVQLDMSLADTGEVAQLRFHAQGCIISQAAASILCEHSEGKRLEELQALAVEEMLELMQVPLVPGRIQCALLPLRALKALVFQELCRPAT